MGLRQAVMRRINHHREPERQDRPDRQALVRRASRCAAVLVVAGLGATACTVPPEDLSPRSGASSAPAPAAASSASSCDTPELSATGGTAEGQLSGAGFTLDEFAALLRDGAVDYVEGEGIGWALDLIGGGGNDDKHSLDEIQDEVKRTEAELDELNTTLKALCAQMSKDFEQVERHQEYTDLQVALQKADGVVSNLATNSAELTVMLNRPVGGLTQQDKDDILQIRSATRADVDQLGKALYPDDASREQGIIAAYAKVLEFDMTNPVAGTSPVSPPSANHLYGNAYMDPMQNLVDYYTGIMLSTLDLLSESFHADFTSGKKSYPSDPVTVETFVNKGLSYVDSWNLLASRGIGRIPEGTVVDTTVSPFVMWTQQPVSLTDDPKATSSCWDVVTFCFANVYDAQRNVLDTTLLPRSDTPMPDRIKQRKPLGLDDWRVPTIDDLTHLTAGAAKQDVALSTWAAGQGLEQFPTRPVTSHLGGKDQQRTVVGPYLARSTTNGVPTGGTSFQATDANQNRLNMDGQAQGQNQDGGLLLLIRDAPVTKLCTDSCATQPESAKISAAHRPRFPKPARATREPERSTSTTSSGATAASATAALGAPTTYNQPTSCASGPTYTVSAGANAVRVTVAGGAGGAGKLEGNTSGQPGGQGGSVSTVIPVQEGATLRVQVGGQGGDTTGGAAGGGGGGGTVPAPWPDAKTGSHSGGGGGASGIAADGTCKLWLVVAGGGGGGGSGWSAGGSNGGSFRGGRGGDACPLPGTSSASCTAAADGQDSYPDHKHGTAGGAPPANAGGHSRDGDHEIGGDGSTLTGGSGARGESDSGGGGGGGGAGYYGGGGGGGGGYRAGGGGGAGGASLAIPGVVADQTSYGLNGQGGSVTITSIAR